MRGDNTLKQAKVQTGNKQTGSATLQLPPKDYSRDAILNRALGRAAYFLKNDRVLAEERLEALNFKLDNAYGSAKTKEELAKAKEELAKAKEELAKTTTPEARKAFFDNPYMIARKIKWDRVDALKEEIKKIEKTANRR